MLLAFKKATAKIYFLHYDIWVKTLYTTLYVQLQSQPTITCSKLATETVEKDVKYVQS